MDSQAVTATRVIATTEGKAAPVLLQIYADHGLVASVELAPAAALALASDLLGLAVTKLPGAAAANA